MTPIPVVTISLDDYNELLKKKNFHEVVKEYFGASATIPDFQDKIKSLGMKLQINNIELEVHVSATYKLTSKKVNLQ